GLTRDIEEYIPEEILKTYHLPQLSTALVWIHMPKSKKKAESARKRFAFAEVLFIQIEKAKGKEDSLVKKAFNMKTNVEDRLESIKRFPITVATGRDNAVTDILKDVQKAFPMTGLLERDVDSGNTAVAATASDAVIKTSPKNK